MPQPQIERKFVALKELKMSDTMPGTVEGYRSVFGEIDEGGDIIVKGAFAASADEYMHSGFSAHSHIWDFKDAVGYPVEAYEDDHGWFVKSEFHTTQGAQDVRTIARERMAAGKQVGFSFGYKTDDFQFIEQKDFKDQLPQFIKADRLEENMKKAQKFNRIRILKKVSAIEDSLVTSPMNKLAAATGVKSETKDDPSAEVKSILDDVIEEREESMSFICDALCTAVWRAQMLDEMSEDSGGTFDFEGALREIGASLTERLVSAFASPEEEGEEDSGAEMASLRGPIDFKVNPRGGWPFAKHTDMALGAVDVFAQRSVALAEFLKGFTERSKAIQELREAKAGATYSGANLAHMQRIHASVIDVHKRVGAMRNDMAALIDKAKKPEKSDDGFDPAALRARAERMRNKVLALTA